MISLIFTNSHIIAAKHNKNSGWFLFSIPLELEESGYAGVAKRVKQKLAACKEKDKVVNITLMENVVFKEFTHQPVSKSVVASLAKLEARNTLADQFDDYAVSVLPYGDLHTENGEENCMLLATPVKLLKCLYSTFSSEGFKLKAVHSGFDAYNAALDKFVPGLMNDKSYATIHIDYEFTLINIYSGGKLASQRRLQGILMNMTPAIASAASITLPQAEEKLRARDYDATFFEYCKEPFTDFVWDILRTVRVVCAPLRIDLDSFLVSGEPCRDKNLCDIIRDNMGNSCIFADDYVSEKMVSFKKPITGAILNIGSCLSTMDLLAPVKTVKKTVAIDRIVGIVLTVIVAIGMAIPPIGMVFSSLTLENWQMKLNALLPVQGYLENVAAANTKLTDIENKKVMLKGYTSTTGETLEDIFDLFSTTGLKLESVAYTADEGLYQVQFTANTKADFLAFKDKMYANSKYYLNLNFSSSQIENVLKTEIIAKTETDAKKEVDVKKETDAKTENDTKKETDAKTENVVDKEVLGSSYLCSVSFVPESFAKMPEPKPNAPVKDADKTMAELELEKLGGTK